MEALYKLGWWRLVAGAAVAGNPGGVAAVADGGCCKGLLLLLPAAFYCLYPSPVFILFFAVYSLAVAVLSVVAEQRWLFSFLFFFFCLSPPFYSHSHVSLFRFLLFFRCSPPPSVSVFASPSPCSVPLLPLWFCWRWQR